jgi:hypothetical protein
MIVRRGPAIVFSLVLGAAALATAPGAVASDGGPAKDVGDGVPSGFSFTDPEKETAPCERASKVKLKVDQDADGRLVVAGIVWSDDDDVWSWRLRHNEELSDKDDIKAKDADKSFKILRTMINFTGPDYVVFRAQNTVTDEVCRAELYY